MSHWSPQKHSNKTTLQQITQFRLHQSYHLRITGHWVPELSAYSAGETVLEAEAGTIRDPFGGGARRKTPVGTRLEVIGYLFLIELQPGGIEREPQNPSGVHQTPPVLGERHRERETPRQSCSPQPSHITVLKVHAHSLGVQKILNLFKNNRNIRRFILYVH